MFSAPYNFGFYNRPLLLLALAVLSGLMLASCGFSPLYGSQLSAERHQVQAALNDISINNIPNREGQYLRNQLVDRFHSGGTPHNPAYRLNVFSLNESRLNLDTTKNANATRAEMTLSARFTLSDSAGGNVLLTRDVVSVTSYNILTSQFTTRVSEDNARLNALEDLARQIEQQIALYFERR